MKLVFKETIPGKMLSYNLLQMEKVSLVEVYSCCFKEICESIMCRNSNNQYTLTVSPAFSLAHILWCFLKVLCLPGGKKILLSLHRISLLGTNWPFLVHFFTYFIQCAEYLSVMIRIDNHLYADTSQSIGTLILTDRLSFSRLTCIEKPVTFEWTAGVNWGTKQEIYWEFYFDSCIS